MKVPVGERKHEIAHRRKHLHVVGGCGKQNFAVAECVGNGLRKVTTCQIVHYHLLTAFFQQFFGKQSRLFRVSVHRSVRYQHTVAFHAVARPHVVHFQTMGNAVRQNRTVQRTYCLNGQLRNFFQQRLHLYAVLSHNADVVATSLVVPRLVAIQCAEFSESVGGKQHFVGAVVGYHHFRPMYHGRKQKLQVVFAQAQHLVVLYFLPVETQTAEVVVEHGKRLAVGHHRGVGERFQKVDNVCRMVRFHVLYHQVVGRASLQLSAQIFQPFVAEIFLDRVHHGNFFINYYIGIVRHALWHFVHAFKHIQVVVVDAHISYVFGYFHTNSPK
ncbi:unknown [Corallococcus sp. CAG:1435]|nr:unknown [Corallococcus sp. CAG:1435]